MNDAVLSQRFPTRDQVARAAQVSLLVERLRAQNKPVPGELLSELQHAWSTYQTLPAFEQQLASRAFEHAKLESVEVLNAEVERQQQADQAQQVDTLVRELTQGLAGRSNGLTLGHAAALRAGGTVHLRAKKLPTGAEADARVRANTGMDLKSYEAKLDDALFMRNMHFYNNHAKYQHHIAEKFPGHSFKDIDRIIRNWSTEAAGLELQRRAQKDAPDTVELRAQPGDEQRLALIESIAEVEGSNRDSVFNRDKNESLRRMVNETAPGIDNPRADIAAAVLSYGGLDAISVGEVREDATDEIVSVDWEEEQP